MDNQNHFHPDTVDQQIEQYLVSRESSTAAQQTVQELQEQLAAQQNNPALDRVWTRLIDYRASSAQDSREPLPISISEYRKGKQMSQITHPPKQGKFVSRLTFLVAAVFLTLLIGSTAFVFQLASKQRNGGNSTTTAAATNNTLYALSGNTAYALDAATQKPLWKHELPARTSKGKPDVSHNPIKVIDGVYYAWWGDNVIYALNAKDGSLLWQHQTPNRVGYLLADSQAAYYIDVTPPAPTSDASHTVDTKTSTRHTTIKALDKKTGTVLWQKPLNGFSAAVLNVFNKILYVSESSIGTDVSFSTYALNTKDGSQVWKQSQPGLLNQTGGYVSGDTFYLSTLDNRVSPSASNVYAYNANKGNLQWQKHYDHDTRLTSVNNGVLYMSAGSIEDISKQPHTSDFIYLPDTIEALSAHDGSLLWKYKAPELNSPGEPIITNDTIYLNDVNEKSNSGTVVALDTQTGKARWTHALTAKPLYNAPIVLQNTIIVGTTGGKVNTLQPLDGSVISTATLDDNVAQQYQYSPDLTTAQ